jgi:hypothetical protein
LTSFNFRMNDSPQSNCNVARRYIACQNRLMMCMVWITPHILWTIRFFIYNSNLWFMSFRFLPVFLGAFVTLRKATVNFVMSVCLPPVHMKHLGSHGKDFHEIRNLSIFVKNMSRKLKFHWSLTRITGNLYKDPRTFMIISRWILLRTRECLRQK